MHREDGPRSTSRGERIGQTETALMEEAATFAVCRMIRHDVSQQRSYKPSIGLPRSAPAGQANARGQVSLRVEGQFPQRPMDLETSGIGQRR